MAATKKRRSRKPGASTRMVKRINPARGTRRAGGRRTVGGGLKRLRRSFRSSNPRSRRRYGRRRRSNPIGSGIAAEAFNFSIASFAVAIGAPAVNRLVGGFLPLGQFQQPVMFALTGFGLGWLASLAPFTRRFQRPLVIVGVSLGITTIITPWVRKLFGGVSVNGGAGMSGWRNRYAPMRGIAAVTGIPPNILPLPPPAPGVMPMGMKGIGAVGRGY